VHYAFGQFGKDVARGLKIWCDWGPQYIADAWINEVKWLGMMISPSYVGEPECNSVTERFMRTLKEQCLYLHGFTSLTEVRDHRRLHRSLQRRVAHRAARPSHTFGRAGRGAGGVTMVTLETRSRRGARIDDRRRSHTVTSLSDVQETGCGTLIWGECRFVVQPQPRVLFFFLQNAILRDE
jgi:hypothetical protein